MLGRMGTVIGKGLSGHNKGQAWAIMKVGEEKQLSIPTAARKGGLLEKVSFFSFLVVFVVQGRLSK